MLTATYSLLAIRSEQRNASSSLLRLRQGLDATRSGNECIDASTLESLFGQMQQFDGYLHARKIEVHVLPALCCMTDEADLLVDELQMLSLSAGRSLSALQQYLRPCAGSREHHPFFLAAEQYCDTVLQRLSKEDESLMSLIGDVLTGEDWFALGARFLAEDGEKFMSRRELSQLMPLIADVSDESAATN